MKQLNIGRKIRYYRQDRNMTQQQLADKVGVSLEMISRYERNVSKPFNKINHIAEALSIPLVELFTKETKLKPNAEIPLFTKIPQNFDFNPDNTTFSYTCPKWIEQKDPETFALDIHLVHQGTQGIYYVSPNVFPFKKHSILCIKEDKLTVEPFRNQKNYIGVILAQESKEA